MKRPRTTAKMREVFENLMRQVDDGELEARVIAEDFNRWLESLADQDAFGTEGQSDPRGDQRS